MRTPFRRRTTAAPPALPADDARAAELLARARAEADGHRWDAWSGRRRAAAAREAWGWMLAAREAGFTLVPPVPPIPAGYLAVPPDLAAPEAVDPALLVSCATCGCVINRRDRGTHAGFHARIAAAQQVPAPQV